MIYAEIGDSTDLISLLRETFRVILTKIIHLEGLVNLLVVVAMVFVWILLGMLVSFIAKVIVLKSKKFEEKHTKQGLTMRRLITNLIKALFSFWIVLMILKEIGIDVVPVLAGAGVVAFAVGFGAQELIKDLIGGFFLILEKTFSIGDTIEVGSMSGVVTDIGLRRTKINGFKGEVITLNNGDIKTVVNLSQRPSVARIEFNVEHATDIRLFESKSFMDFLEDFGESYEDVLENPTSVIITSLTDGHISLRTQMVTKTRKNVGLERDFRKALVNYCHDNGIDLEIPVVLEMSE